MSVLPVFAQTTNQEHTTLPHDPLAILKAAQPHYDLSNPNLKPWHLKATYQLYDFQGKPSEPGTWEFWWAAPRKYRIQSQRGNKLISIWVEPDGSVYREQTGGDLRYFESRLEDLILHPFPNLGIIASKDAQLGLQVFGEGPKSSTCVTSVHRWVINGIVRLAPPARVSDYYCFDPSSMALVTTFIDPVLRNYSHFVELEGLYFARQISVQIEKQVMLSVTVETLEGTSDADPAFDRPAEAALVLEPITASAKAQPNPKKGPPPGSLLKVVEPVYPTLAKSEGIQGVVYLGANYGADGGFHNLEILAAPSELLGEAALGAVRQWEYKPYTRNGKPIELERMIEISFTLPN